MMDEQFVSIDGLQKWEREGHLTPVRTVTNHRRYRVADLRALMHEEAPDVARDTRCLLPPSGISDMPGCRRKNSKKPETWIVNSDA